MDSHNCGGNLIPNVVMLERSGGRYWVDGFRCSYCGEEIVKRDTALSIEKLERERDELLTACEELVDLLDDCIAGGGYDSLTTGPYKIIICKAKGDHNAGQD